MVWQDSYGSVWVRTACPPYRHWNLGVWILAVSAWYYRAAWEEILRGNDVF